MGILAVGRGSHADLATSPTSDRVPTQPGDKQVRLCPTPSSLRVTSPSGRNSQGVSKTAEGSYLEGAIGAIEQGFDLRMLLVVTRRIMRCYSLFGRRITACPEVDDWAQDNLEIY